MENVVISKNIKKIVGVYAIWNLENQKVYIGSSKNIKNLRYYEYISIIHFNAISNGYNTQSVIEHEPREVTAIRFLAGSLDFYSKGTDDEDKEEIIYKILNN